MSRTTRSMLGVAAVVLLLDGITKWLTVTRLADAPLDLGWVVLRSARNTGISFSIGAGSSPWLVTTLTGAACVAILVLALRGAIEPPLAAGLLMGGGLGNFLDRLDDGAVVDMVDLGWFPVFNVADIALNLGVGVVLVAGLLASRREITADGDASDDAEPDSTEPSAAGAPDAPDAPVGPAGEQ